MGEFAFDYVGDRDGLRVSLRIKTAIEHRQSAADERIVQASQADHEELARKGASSEVGSLQGQFPGILGDRSMFDDPRFEPLEVFGATRIVGHGVAINAWTVKVWSDSTW